MTSYSDNPPPGRKPAGWMPAGGPEAVADGVVDLHREALSGGLSPETQAWLSGAGTRLNEPVRQDRREDVQARGDAFAAIEADLRSDSDDALSLLAAGWRPPTAIAALVAAARAETAERIAVAIEGSTQLAGDQSTAWNPYTDGRLAQARKDAQIARETR